jgi:hypothetical protein
MHLWRRARIVLTCALVLGGAIAGSFARVEAAAAARPATPTERTRIVAAIRTYVDTSGCCAVMRRIKILSVTVSTVDPLWAVVTLDGIDASGTDVGVASAVFHRSVLSGQWDVRGFGTSPGLACKAQAAVRDDLKMASTCGAATGSASSSSGGNPTSKASAESAVLARIMALVPIIHDDRGRNFDPSDGSLWFSSRFNVGQISCSRASSVLFRCSYDVQLGNSDPTVGPDTYLGGYDGNARVSLGSHPLRVSFYNAKCTPGPLAELGAPDICALYPLP